MPRQMCLDPDPEEWFWRQFRRTGNGLNVIDQA
jgi:hypothetical protein